MDMAEEGDNGRGRETETEGERGGKRRRGEERRWWRYNVDEEELS